MTDLFSYQPLWKLLDQLRISKTELRSRAGLTPATLARLSKNETVSMETLERICNTLDVEVEQIMKRIPTLGQSGTFSPNKKEAIHGWYPYLEGYSKSLVEEELLRNRECEVVYDPFGGSGTTALVAVLQGKRGLYSEINPVMRFIAEKKLLAAQMHSSESAVTLDKLRHYHSAIDEMREDEKNVNGFSLGEFNRFFSVDNLQAIGQFRRIIDNESNPFVRDLLKVALAAVAVPVSLMIRRGDLRFATAKEREKTSHEFWESARNKINEIINDVISLESLEAGTHSYVSDDVRDSKLLNEVDAIVTSPPYLNGTNYFRNTKLELRLLDFIGHESELSSFYQQGITAGINNVSKRRPYAVPNIDGFDQMFEELENEAYDSRIPKMVNGYFCDMEQAIQRMYDALRPGGTLSFDIGDSQFAGVHIPTHEILDLQLKTVGFEMTDETILRTRRSRNGMQLSQRVMRYRK